MYLWLLRIAACYRATDHESVTMQWRRATSAFAETVTSEEQYVLSCQSPKYQTNLQYYKEKLQGLMLVAFGRLA